MLNNDISVKLLTYYEQANKDGFEAFPNGIPGSNAFNATPYVIDFARFEIDFGFNCDRTRYLEKLRELLIKLVALGANAHFLIVGGSFLERASEAPRDLDCVLFYSLDSGAAKSITASMASIAEQAREQKVDIRFLPLDTHPTLVAKTIGFFCVLYTQRRAGTGLSPCLIVDLAERPAELGWSSGKSTTDTD